MIDCTERLDDNDVILLTSEQEAAQVACLVNFPPCTNPILFFFVCVNQ